LTSRTSIENFLKKLDREASQASLHQRLPLSFSGHVIGSVAVEILDQLASNNSRLEELNLERLVTGSGDMLVIQSNPTHSIYLISTALMKAGLAVNSHEILTVWAGSDVLSCIPRSVVRLLGVNTHSVHLVAKTPTGLYWVQRRSEQKKEDPGLWDTTVGGTVQYNETPTYTLEREMWEESGLKPTDCLDISALGNLNIKRPRSEDSGLGFQVETIHCFSTLVSDDFTPMNHDGEVDLFEPLESSEILRRLVEDRFTLEAALVLVQLLKQEAVIKI